MAAQQRLLSFWVLMLLITALCPGSLSKRGGGVKGRGKSDGDQASSSQSRGLSKKGLKGAGSAAAGMLGGKGYRLGFIGKPKHGTGNHHSHKTEQHQQPAYQETQRYNNQSLWRAFVRGSAPATGRNFLLTLGHGVPFLTTAWIRDV
ncbi:hypothetical protein CRENBAI_004195 [Crenichthys baileyi]|uniref:Shadow of prion protein 2 n=1 Tax=Crenichthys baileyi TaxID=28760 RepID=A0AAV9RN57_9TELE